jgi:hypothetical protein
VPKLGRRLYQALQIKGNRRPSSKIQRFLRSIQGFAYHPPPVHSLQATRIRFASVAPLEFGKFFQHTDLRHAASPEDSRQTGLIHWISRMKSSRLAASYRIRIRTLFHHSHRIRKFQKYSVTPTCHKLLQQSLFPETSENHRLQRLLDLHTNQNKLHHFQTLCRRKWYERLAKHITTCCPSHAKKGPS